MHELTEIMGLNMSDQFSLFSDAELIDTATAISSEKKNLITGVTHLHAGQCYYEKFPLEDTGKLTLITNLFTGDYANLLYETLHRDIRWSQDSLRIAGKNIPIPRLQAWYGESHAAYGYSGLKLTPLRFIEPLTLLRQVVTQISNLLLPPCITDKTATQPICYNSVLCNLYRNEKDSVGWHSDDEAELGSNPIIASISLGATRRFQLKHKRQKNMRHALLLPHNSLLIMSGNMQHHWYHQVPKSNTATGPRINLTFRHIV